MGNSEPVSSSSSFSQTPLKLLKPPTSPTLNSTTNSQSTLDEIMTQSDSCLTHGKSYQRTRSSKSFGTKSLIENSRKLSCSSFIIKNEIKRTKSSRGKMMLVANKSNMKKNLAMCSIRKADLCVSNLEIETLKEEVKMCENPFISKIKYFFESHTQVYFVQNYYEQSHMKNFLKNHQNLKEDEIRFYMAQTILAFELLPKNNLLLNKFALHFNSDNFFFDNNGHIAMDILAMVLKKENEDEIDDDTYEYMTPEAIENGKFTIGSSFAWKIGIFLYEMATGMVPFHSKEEILKRNIKFPINFSPIMVDLIEKLLIANPSKRLGHKSIEEIKNHEFFRSVDWENILKKEMNGPILKTLERENDFGIVSLKDLDESEISGSEAMP